MPWKEQPGWVQGKHRFPTELHEQVVESASRHKRSLNEEIIVRLGEAYGRAAAGGDTSLLSQSEIDRRVARMLREVLGGKL